MNKKSTAKTSTAKTSTAKTSAAKTSTAKTSAAKTSMAKTSAAKTSMAKKGPSPFQRIEDPVVRRKVASRSFIRMMIVIAILLFILFAFFGCFKIQRFLIGGIDAGLSAGGKFMNLVHPDSDVRVFPDEATVGVFWKSDFSKDLLLLLQQSNGTSSPPYTFFLGTGVGLPPAGLTFDANGTLSGTLTGKSSTFDVCVTDVNEKFVCITYRLNVKPQVEPDVDPTDSNPPSTPDFFSGNWKTPGPVKFYDVELGSRGENNQRKSVTNARSLSLWIRIKDGFISGDCMMDFIDCNQLSTYSGVWTACIPQVPYPGGTGKYAGPLSFSSSFNSPKIVGNKLTTSYSSSAQNQDMVFTLVKKDPAYGGKDALYVDLTSVGGGYDADPGTIVLIRQ